MALSIARECPIDYRQRMQQQSAPVGLDNPAPLQGSKMRRQRQRRLPDAESVYGEAPLLPREFNYLPPDRRFRTTSKIARLPEARPLPLISRKRRALLEAYTFSLSRCRGATPLLVPEDV